MVKDYWEARSSSWIKGRNERDSSEVVMKYIDYICDFLSNESRVLEVGCGTGRYSHHFAHIKNLYSFDFIGDFVDVARQIMPNNATVFVDDVTELTFNLPVDVIFTMAVLQHVDVIEFAVDNLTKLGAKDIILLEGGLNIKQNSYQFNHDYVALFREFGYSSYSVFSLDDSLPNTLVYHFRRIE